ncbi:penicillin-binding protein 2 [Helicobacter enhydrae]|uniref:Penicillin-binding protein 2 n=1 Tax=Helicobacter enhydrae TaxID=222136 RepID=A0A1B1U435_9HELI|nr:penicillin-binding protein 2 [Helicobacter enhydrae]ANV97501.1 penicillin-binding protein 2 [Helicobacter enhydrae]
MLLRFRIIFGFCVLVSIVLIMRIYFLSIKSNVYFEKIAQRNTQKSEVLVPSRGQIIDRNHRFLATNELGFSIAFSPFLNTQKKLDAQIEFLQTIFADINPKEIKKNYYAEYSPYNHLPIVVVPFVSYAEIDSRYTQLLQNPNVIVEPNTKRFYPYGSSASHVIGYAGSANAKEIQKDITAKYTKIVGKLGLEKKYNDFLQGELGNKKTKVNALNQEVEFLSEKPLQNGGDIQISLDIALQEKIDKEFVGKSGAVVVMDLNGEILAAGSYPEYDLNDFVGGISHQKWNDLIENPHKPLINKFSIGTYPPGSVVKMGMALSFLESIGIDEKTLIDTPEYVELGGRKFRDWKIGGHGKSDMVKAIKESVDVYFYVLAQKAGIENIAPTLAQMGFGEKSGIDLPNEAKGIVPTPEWKMRQSGQQWFIGDTINTSIGQGAFLATPIQIARYTALLASGKLPTPHFVTQMNGKKIEYVNQDILTPLQKSKLRFLTLGMYKVCNDPNGGTAYRRTQGSKVPIACKTGTAQVVGIPQEIKKRIKEEEMAYFHRSHGWITAFVPYKNPQYVVTILVEHGGGSKSASPILVNIVNTMKDLGYFNKRIENAQ